MKPTLVVIFVAGVVSSGCAYMPAPMYPSTPRPVVVEQVVEVQPTSLSLNEKFARMEGFFEGCVSTAVSAERINHRIPKRLEVQGYCVKQVVDMYPWAGKLDSNSLAYMHLRFNAILDYVDWSR